MGILFDILSTLLPVDWLTSQIKSDALSVFFSALWMLAIGVIVGLKIVKKRLSAKDTEIAGLKKDVESANAISSEKDMTISDIRRALDIAEANCEDTLRERGESLEDVRFRQDLLDALSKASTSNVRENIIRERLESGAEASDKNRRAIDDLKKYGCIDGVSVYQFAGRTDSVPYFGRSLEVLRNDYPNIAERRDIDLMEKIDTQIAIAFKDYAREIERARRML